MSDGVTELESLLRDCFSPVELYGLMCRSYGNESWVSPPLFSEQDEIYSVVSEGVFARPSNRFFFEELRSIRLHQHQSIAAFAVANKVPLPPLKRLPSPLEKREKDMLFSLRASRFTIFTERQLASSGRLYEGWDCVQGIPIQVWMSANKTTEQQEESFHDLLVLAQLPHQNLESVYDVGLSPDKAFYIVSDMVQSPMLEINDEALVISLMRQLVIALDAAHQRDIFHSEILPHQIHWDSQWNAQLGGFGQALVTEEDMFAELDFAALGKWLAEVWRGESGRITKIIEKLQDSAVPRQTLPEVEDIIDEPFTEELTLADVFTEEVVDKPVMRVEVGDKIRIWSWFGDGHHGIILRNVGDGLLPVHITSDQPWLKVVQERPEPRRVSQVIDIVFIPDNLRDVRGEGKLFFNGPDGQTREILVVGQKAFWLWPLIFMVVATVSITWWLLGK